jgi:hypothetical protein
LDVDTLNAIPGIKTLPDSNTYHIDYLRKIFELPIDFKNLDKTIVGMFQPIYRNYFFKNSSILNRYNEIYSAIYFIFKTGKVQTNPLITIVLETSKIERYYISIINTFKKPEDALMLTKFKNCIKYFQYLCSHFNWEAPPNLKTVFDKFYTKEELETYQADKDKWIIQFEKNQVHVKKNIKVTKTKTKIVKHDVHSDSDDNIDV